MENDNPSQPEHGNASTNIITATESIIREALIHHFNNDL